MTLLDFQDGIFSVAVGIAFIRGCGEAGFYNVLELPGHKGALELLTDGDSLVPLGFRLSESPV